ILIDIIIGKINEISISKIKKIIVIKKNRIEKGMRLKNIGLNPHSNGDIFSKFNFSFIEIIKEIFIIIIDKIREIVIINISLKIKLEFINSIILLTVIYLFLVLINFLYNWKLYILIYIN
uniref:hypothetical protein n=1 Tax=Mycobacterium tuberculosis TaxID=1773 RepID=UPI001F3ACD31